MRSVHGEISIVRGYEYETRGELPLESIVNIFSRKKKTGNQKHKIVFLCGYCATLIVLVPLLSVEKKKIIRRNFLFTAFW